MTDPEQTEAEVAELFAQTRQNADGAQLTKMSARAQDVPRAQHRWFPRWLWAPAAAIAATGIIALWATEPLEPSMPDEVAPVTPAVTINADVDRQHAAATAKAPERNPAEVAIATDELEQLQPLKTNALASMVTADESEEEAWNSLYGPPPDADLDAWLAATEVLLAEGG